MSSIKGNVMDVKFAAAHCFTWLLEQCKFGIQQAHYSTN